MTITKEYCDRCGKEVEMNPLNHKIFPIVCRTPKYHLRFRDHFETVETTKMVCEECMKDFWKWWKPQ